MSTPLLFTSPRPELLADLAAQFGAKTARGAEGLTELRVHPSVPRAELEELLTRCHPVQLDVSFDSAVEGMVLKVGTVARVATPLRVRVPPAWRDDVTLASLAVQTPSVHVAALSEPPKVSVAAHLLLAILGLPDSGCWQDEDTLLLRVNERACRAIQPARVMRLYGDAGTVVVCRRQLRRLRRDGWQVEVVETELPAAEFGVLVPQDLDPSVNLQLVHSLRDLGKVGEPTPCTHAQRWVEVRLPALREAGPALPMVVLRTDEQDEVGDVVRELRELGVPDVVVLPRERFGGGFSVRHHRTHPVEFIREIERLVGAAIDACGASERHFVNVYVSDNSLHLPEVQVDLPTRAGRDGSLLRALLAAADMWHVRVANMARPATLVRRLEAALSAGGSRARVSADPRRYPFAQVVVGAAPLEIAHRVAAVIQAETGVLLPVYRASGCEEDEVRVILPEAVALRPQAAPRLHARSRRPQETRAFLEVSERTVRVGEHTFPRGQGHALAPSEERFEHTCVDNPTAALLEHIATSVRLREPALLEGATAAGKTSTVMFLAALLRQPVCRVNLGGQTDTGELVGRYAPCDGGWRWQEGVIPRAMREGWWVILDEIYLADPAVIERLNPVLERTPSLLVTEGDNARFGPGGTPVSPAFHVFATMNPSDGEYGGRNALSPALRDRFPGQRLCPTPGEADSRDLLLRLVFGLQPAVNVNGVGWGSSPGHPATHGSLVGLAGIQPALEALSRFHASVDAAAHAEAEDQRLGGGRRGGVVLSRRTLLSVLDYLVLRSPEVGLQRAVDEAVDRYYVARVGTPADRQAILRLADASGLLAAGAGE